MLTLNELIELKNNVISGNIEVESAKSICFKGFNENSRSWHTNDWKERRLIKLKDKCEICGSNEILTIQHLSHPKTLSEFKKETTTAYTKSHVNQNIKIDKKDFYNYIVNNYNYIAIPLCPNCEGRNPNKRTRKKPQYLCSNCHYEFEDAISKSVEELLFIYYSNEEVIAVRDKCFTSKDKWKNKNNLSNIEYWYQREIVKNDYIVSIEKEAFLLYLDDHIKYLSHEDTITACKKCAYNYDMLKMELCPKCKKKYKGIQYPTCIECLPEDKKIKAKEKIDFAISMKNIEKDLGID